MRPRTTPRNLPHHLPRHAGVTGHGRPPVSWENQTPCNSTLWRIYKKCPVFTGRLRGDCPRPSPYAASLPFRVAGSIPLRGRVLPGSRRGFVWQEGGVRVQLNACLIEHSMVLFHLFHAVTSTQHHCREFKMETLIIKSITTHHAKNGMWCVRVRCTNGAEFFDPAPATYTLAQAQLAIDNTSLRRGTEFHPCANGFL